MSESVYFRSPTKQELRQQKLVRKEAARNKQCVLGSLSAVLSQGGVYEEPEETAHIITDIPSEFLPKQRKAKTNVAESCLKREATNHAYIADLRSRPPAPEAKRPVVSAEQPLGLSWEATHHGKNDTSNVQSKLAFTKGAGEVPEIYTPGEENPRRAIEAKRKERESKKVPPPEKKPEPFVYQPKVTHLAAGEVPGVVALVPTEPVVEKKRPASSGIHGKAFK